jgi:zinc protease
MRIRNLFACLLILTFVMTGTSAAQSADKLPPVKITQYKLKNGLTVVLHQDRSTPVVAVNTWYHVGSKNEAAGRTGFAHLFEHMMFQGSRNYNNDYFTPLSEAGGSINGTTNQDRTWYYETVPSNFLELAIYMEADRLGGLLDAMTQEKLDNQRDVVKNERRQRVDNQPYGASFEKIGEIMYPKGHPYNWTTIGSLEDLQAASLEDVKGFFRQYYVPNNTILVLSGDFDEKQAKGWVEKYFGPIPTGGDISRPSPEMPKLDKEIRTQVEDSLARFPRRYMVWHTVKQYAPDEPALDILSFILSNGRTSRLQSNLLYDKKLVSSVFGGNNTGEIGGTFQITATANPGKNLDDIEKEINAELDRIKKDPPTADEMARAKNSIESQTIFGLQTVLGKGSQIGNYAGYLNNPNWFQEDLDRYQRVTPADVQRVANTYLGANRLVMTYVPKQGEANRSNSAANQPTSVKPAKKADDTAAIEAQAAKLPKAGPIPKLALPPIEKAKLSNGLEVWMVKQSELPIVAMNMVFKTGATAEPKGKEGVAGLASNLIDDGTKTRSAEDIANQLAAIGANVNAGSGWDSTNVSMNSMTKNLDQALDIYADVITNPSYPQAELTNLQGRMKVGFQVQKTNPNIIGNNAYNKVLYGSDHPYGRQLNGNEKTVPGITRDDIVKYYEGTYKPNNAVLIVVGDVDKKMLIPKLETAFAGWKPGEVMSSTVPAAGKLDKTGIYLVDRPGSAQSVVSIGQVGIERSNPDYFPVVVMNAVLGGGITSRISMNLREDKGYTYGANSGWQYRKGAGPFSAGGDMQTAVTKEAVWEVMKELTEIRQGRPVSQKELDYNKQSIIRRYPGAFETSFGISNQLSNLVVYGLPDTYFSDYISKINAVTLEDVNRVANKYLDPSKMAIVIVGDRKVVEGGLKELGYPLTILDVDGNVVTQ